ncbi:RAMP superfamily CRISPR-associated protein [Maridesulfovibrio zosterae]|uniref:RAMP superfamily CRISPR-associated protein n=1 Tax=Maridesulfovibrio zosterae TaxID=82171 RepID=UPI0004192CD2|nr:RAMP superfamily CRISPR-associated protein [Maridesulfovibrio zosterae]
MQNELKEIVYYKGVCTLVSEFCTSGSDDSNIESELSKTVDGKIYYRGSSLRGVLRHELVRYFGGKCRVGGYAATEHVDKSKVCSCSVCRVFGSSSKAEAEEKDLLPSRIHVYTDPFEDVEIRVRNGVAIERRTGTAANHKKYNYEAVLPGARFAFLLRMENPSDEEMLALEHILKELNAGLVSIGRKGTSGMGRVSVECDKYAFDFSKQEQVLQYLASPKRLPQGKKLTFGGVKEEVPDFMHVVNGKFRAALHFNIIFPSTFIINDPLEAALSGHNLAPVTLQDNKPHLPGTSLRGVFRSRAERILRTLGKDCCDPSLTKDNKPDFLPDHMLLSCSGSKNQECAACRVFGKTDWKSRVSFAGGIYAGSSSSDERPVHDHVAIDRFHGGALDGAKFREQVCHGAIFKDSFIQVQDVSLWEFYILLMTFADFYMGDLSIGSGTRNGHGRVFPEMENSWMVVSAGNELYRFRITDLMKYPALEQLVEMIEGASEEKEEEERHVA